MVALTLLLFTSTTLAEEHHQFASSQLGEQVAYRVAVPPSFSIKQQRRYPLLVVLDAEQQFSHIACSVTFLAGHGDIPELIVVGIDSNNRLRDYTPTDWSDMNGEDGGGPKFKRFLADEFLPNIEKAYRGDGYRILFGHSLGGLFGLYLLADEPELFRAYLITSPTLDWDRTYARRSVIAGFGGDISAPSFLYLARSDDSGQALQDYQDYVAAIAQHAPKALRWHSSEFPDEMHVTVPLIAGIDALRQLFSGYRLHPDLYERGIDYAEGHFAAVSEKIGHELPMPEQVANELGYAALNADRFAEAITLLEHNARNFPDSANAADSLADAYAKAERWQDAADSESRAVSMGEAQHDRNLGYFRTQLQRYIEASKAATDITMPH